MTEKINSPDIRDFWDDGIKFDEPKLSKKSNINNHKMKKSKSCVILNTINENDNYKAKKENKLLRNHKLIQHYIFKKNKIYSNKRLLLYFKEY